MQAKKEAAEAEELKRELNVTNSDLENMILSRGVDRKKETNDFFAGLEAKYCQKEKKKSTRSTSSTASKSTKRKRK